MRKFIIALMAFIVGSMAFCGPYDYNYFQSPGWVLKESDFYHSTYTNKYYSSRITFSGNETFVSERTSDWVQQMRDELGPSIEVKYDNHKNFVIVEFLSKEGYRMSLGVLVAEGFEVSVMSNGDWHLAMNVFEDEILE